MKKLFNIFIKRELVFVLILTVFIFLSSRAIFHEGFFRTVDDITTVRIDYMEKELLRNNWVNNFPVRMSGELSNNYGYPLYLFYAPLIYYVGASLKIFLGLSHIVATKYVYVFPLLFGPIFFYFAARQRMSPLPSLVASIFVTTFPYRALNTYILGAAGQAWAISFIPLAMAGLFLLSKYRVLGGAIFAFTFFLILISHLLTGVLFAGFSLVYGLIFLIKNKDFWKYYIIGIGLSSFYLLPMLFYLKIIRVTYLEANTTHIIQTLESLNELFKIHIYNLSNIPIHHPAYKISGLFIFIIIGGLLYFIYRKLKGDKNLKEVFFWGFSGLILYLLLFEPLKYFWQFTWQITGIFQFAWRLLALLSFIIPLFLGMLIAHITNLYLKYALIIVVIITAIIYVPIFKPETYSFYYEYKPEGICATTSWQDEFLPIWVKEGSCPPPREPLKVIPDTQIGILSDNSLDIFAEVELETKSELIVNKYYFPGWHVYIDGIDSPLEWKFSIDGIFKTSLAPGNHQIQVIYKKTPIMWLADAISLVSLVFFGYFILNFQRKRIINKS